MKNLKKIFRHTLSAVLAFFALVLAGYLLFIPFYPKVIYEIEYNNPQTDRLSKNTNIVRKETEDYIRHFPQAEYKVSPNRLIIKKIGVNTPIVESGNPEYGLSLGSWHDPQSSTPDKQGNTVLTGHRFKYLPPNNTTFYLLDKLGRGDVLSVIWDGRVYIYKVKETKIVSKNDISILKQGDGKILTLYTCDPVYSTENRLVVVSELVEIKEAN